MDLKYWSTTPANNATYDPDINWQEGQAPSTVNGSARQMMAAIRSKWEDAQWFNYGSTVYPIVYVAATQFRITGADATSIFEVGRRVRAVGTLTGTIYGTITTSVFSTNTTVTVIWDSGSLNSETLNISISIISNTNNSIPYLNKKGSDVASASTIDLNAVNGELIDVTGTTAITAITLNAGQSRIVRFTGILTLTNGSSLILPTGANITTAAGDFAIFAGYASGVVRCVGYLKANGQALAASGSFTDLSASGKFSTPSVGTVTIATDTLTITSSTFVVEGEGSVSDNLATINGGVNGMTIDFSILNASHVITIKHGTGNIICEGQKDLRVANTDWQIRGKYRSSDSKWLIWVVNNKTYGDLVDIQTASSSTNLQFLNLNSAYRVYEFEFINILPSVNAVMLTAQYSTDNGATWLNSSYKQRKNWANTTDADGSYTDKTSGLTIAGRDGDVNAGVGNNSARGGVRGKLFLYDPSNTSNYKGAHWYAHYYISTSYNYYARSDGIGTYEGSTSAINAIQFLFKTVNSDTTNGNIASGTILLYGKR
ncbi:MAG: hypothetical protein EBS06_05470 [Proteobacteria bacterium]|nr:hypothetical protein [Pseudomonadota bacterium]